MRQKTYTILIAGPGANETADHVKRRLLELKTQDACSLDIHTNNDALEQEADFVYSMGTHDAPAFAAEKILDQFAERGWVTLDAGELSPEEEAQIRARLQGLGYVD